jgi:hypothetical protein
MGSCLPRSTIAAAAAALSLILSSTIAVAAFSLVRVSGPSPFAAGCNGAPQTGTLYPNAEVEPYVAVNPRNRDNIVGVWQQDRFSNGGANGLLTGVSRDGGRTWRSTFAHFSRCAGGTAANNGAYERASDPWVTFGPNGTAYQVALSFNDSDFNQAVLASRSRDGGATWSEPAVLALDTAADVALDKEAVTADPARSGFVYAVWDRLTGLTSTNPQDFFGPVWFSRTTNEGASWEKARIIFDPGPDAQTIGSHIVVLPNGDLVNVFNLIKQAASALISPMFVAVIRSSDQGLTWSAPVIVNELGSIGITDPKTGQPVRTGDVLPDIAVDRENAVLYTVWQDARFSGGKRDGIAFSSSTDGGLTWSAPRQINRATRVQAFTAAINVSQDGNVGVTYYDFRKDNADPSVLLTNVWLTRSEDGGQTWHEVGVAGPFDMLTAPFARGFFVGDYEGLSPDLMPFFVQANSGNLANRTDVFAALGGDEDTAGGDREDARGRTQTTRQQVRSHREVHADRQ